jgi:Uma2 family endonuclease
MKFDIPSPPRTIMDVYKSLPEGTLAELINGQIYMSPSPTNQHQRILKKILRILDEFVEKQKLGEVFISPSDVYLDETSNAVQPDLYFVSMTNKMIVKSDKPNQGIPDMVLEILSKDEKHDLITKKNLYEKFGIKEYWIIDPFTKEAFVYQYLNAAYQLAGKDTGKIYSPLFQHQFEF